MNRLFVAYKPSGVSSNRFLGELKRKYGVKKGGFSGTLDPFAKGVLVVGFGSHTKLFRFLELQPKRYRATLHLGANSPSLDTENVLHVDEVGVVDEKEIQKALKSLKGDLEYHPPSFSAKKVNGKRAYDLAREGMEFSLKKIKSTIYDIKLLDYTHPYITFEATVSKGTYIRSLGLMIANALGVRHGSLSMLERLSEGKFVYDDEKALDIKEYLSIAKNVYMGDMDNIRYGRVLAFDEFEVQKDGTYYIDNDESISVITIKDKKVKYELGRIELC